jgi:hypothetical protein
MQKVTELLNHPQKCSGLLDFVHRPDFSITRKHNVSETGVVSVFR